MESVNNTQTIITTLAKRIQELETALNDVTQQLEKQQDTMAPTIVNGIKTWKNAAGQYHRDNDLPALIHATGTQYWYQNGYLHRENDQPAVVYTDGSQEWWYHGRRHRDNDKPASIHSDRDIAYYKYGVKYTPA
jgi:hypothetical protein